MLYYLKQIKILLLNMLKLLKIQSFSRFFFLFLKFKVFQVFWPKILRSTFLQGFLQTCLLTTFYYYCLCNSKNMLKIFSQKTRCTKEPFGHLAKYYLNTV